MMVVAAHPEEVCPYCENKISRAKFNEVQARIRAEEQKTIQAAEAEVRRALEAQHKAERDAADQKAREALAEAKEKLEESKRERTELERQQKLALEKAQDNARKAAEAQLAKQIEALQQKSQADLARAREVLKAESDRQLVEVQAEAQRKLEAMAKQLAEVQQKLKDRDASDVANVNVLAALKEAFRSDKIVPRPVIEGSGGADIVIDIQYRNATCGRVVVDSRQRRNLQVTYATKLRADQVDQKADYAILATTTFPKNRHGLCEYEGVLLVEPARVVALVDILRKGLIEIRKAKLSDEKRGEKKTRLYELVTSTAYQKKFAEAGKLAASLLELEVQEKSAHDLVWKKRGNALRKIQTVTAELETEVAEIIDGQIPNEEGS